MQKKKFIFWGWGENENLVKFELGDMFQGYETQKSPKKISHF